MPRVYINGKFYEKEDAKVSVYDHGLLYGDGVFEGIRVYNGRAFELDAHLQRLWDSSKAIRLVVPYTREQLRAAIDETIKASGYREAYIRLIVSRGAGYLGLSPTKCERPCVVDRVAVGDDPVVESAGVAHDGDVQADAVRDGRDRVERFESRAGEVERVR